MFDTYISLGDNCETGIVLKYAGIDEGSLFRFAYANINNINNILENNFQNLYEFENLIPNSKNMVVDTKYGINFHTKMLSQKGDDGSWIFEQNEVDRIKIYKDEYNKYIYLIDKWKAQRKNDSILYIIKAIKDSLDSNGVSRLLSNLEKLDHSKEFKLLILIDKDSKFKFEHEKVFVRKMLRFAKFNDAYDFHFVSWNMILRKFFGISLKYDYTKIS